MIRKLLHSLKLDSDIEDCDIIYATIEKDIVFKGTNLWILAFAIIVACVGLNMNSTAVIIGAMLISPLMGPINGMGYSLATYNLLLFRKAAKNFTFAFITGLIASTLYFTVSPVSIAHSELLARTSPTIYDVLIALFGGLAGIIAISSKSKGNVIPGVAIATALMPPLCTAGYGLATVQFSYFFGAIYLFTINTVFIALSSVAVSQVLNFPIRTLVDSTQKIKINRIITIVILITIIPSIYFGYRMVQKEAFTERASKFTRSVSIIEGNYLLKSEIGAGEKKITLIYGGNTLSDIQKRTIKEKAKDFSLSDATLIFEQGFSVDKLTKGDNEIDGLKTETNRMNLLLQEKEKIQEATTQRTALGKQIFLEIKTLYPQIISCTYSEASTFHNAVESPGKTDVIVFQIKKGALKNKDRQKIRRWLHSRLESKEIKIFYEK